MNMEIQIFKNERFGEVRTMVINGEPWFVGKDVASVLGYSNHRKALIDHIDADDKMDGVTIRDSIGRGQTPIFINESGLYSLILSSKLPQAKEFKRWVTSEVLPQIRQTGGYIPVSKDDDESAIQRKAIDIMNRTIERMKPKAVLALADEIIGKELSEANRDAEDTLTATQVAKTFNMTVFNFNAVLRDLGIQYRRYGRWNISDDLADRDFVRLRTHVSYSLKGRKKVRTYMTWTMSGLHYLNAKLGYPNF
jgi:prophage antirepressor-like protein